MIPVSKLSPSFAGQFSVKFWNDSFPTPYRSARYTLLREQGMDLVLADTYQVSKLSDHDVEPMGGGRHKFLQLSGHVPDDLANGLAEFLRQKGGQNFQHTPDASAEPSPEDS